MPDGSSAGSLFCGWSIGLTANRLFAGFLNLVFACLHLVNMVTGRFLLAKTSAYITAATPLADAAFFISDSCPQALRVFDVFRVVVRQYVLRCQRELSPSAP